jgi:hypothetical protein
VLVSGVVGENRVGDEIVLDVSPVVVLVLELLQDASSFSSSRGGTT